MNDYHYSFDEWLSICDKYYHDKPPIQSKDARLIVPNLKEPDVSSYVGVTVLKDNNGYYYVVYKYKDENNKSRKIIRNSIDSLKQAVLDKGLDWVELNRPIVNLFD